MASYREWSEDSLFHDFWDDGLVDLLAGLALVVAGLGWQTRLGILAILQAPLWIVLWGPLRQAVVEPRAGYVEFCRARQRRNTRKTAMAAALGLAVLALAVFAMAWPGMRRLTALQTEWAAGLPALIVAAMAVLAALLTGVRRFFLYAALSLAAATGAIALNLHPGMPLGTVGVAAALGGAWLLARFLRGSRAFDETG